jgi:DNA/RNA-binding domain of Phe-tRNA-synthetase-like protein
MNLAIDPGLQESCPRLRLASLRTSVHTQLTSIALEQQLSSCEARIRELADPKSLLESPEIGATRAAYKALGKDPARYRGSAEALLRRVISGKPLPRVNNVVDVINIISVQSRLPIGLYDFSQLSGDILFRRGKIAETYKGIGKYDLNLEGLPVFVDAIGPYGSPTSDSERTMVTGKTREVLAIMISFGGPVAAAQSLGGWIERLAELFRAHAGSTEQHLANYPAT